MRRFELKHVRSFSVFIALAAFVTVLSHRAEASLLSASYTGSGTSGEVSSHPPLAGEVDLSINNTTSNTSILTVVLTNTGTSATTDQGAALTGVVFDIVSSTGGSLSSTLASTTLTNGSKIWTSGTASNTSDPLAGSWTDVLQVNTLSGSAVNTGVATTGFNGVFKGGGGAITLGNASPDYGLVASKTFSGSIGGSKYPFIQDSLTFTFDLTGGTTDASHISDVFFLFGTSGCDLIPGSPSGPPPVTATVPEPVSLLVWGGISATVAGAAAIRKRKVAGRWSKANRAAIYRAISCNPRR